MSDPPRLLAWPASKIVRSNKMGWALCNDSSVGSALCSLNGCSSSESKGSLIGVHWQCPL